MTGLPDAPQIERLRISLGTSGTPYHSRLESAPAAAAANLGGSRLAAPVEVVANAAVGLRAAKPDTHWLSARASEPAGLTETREGLGWNWKCPRVGGLHRHRVHLLAGLAGRSLVNRRRTSPAAPKDRLDLLCVGAGQGRRTAHRQAFWGLTALPLHAMQDPEQRKNERICDARLCGS